MMGLDNVGGILRFYQDFVHILSTSAKPGFQGLRTLNLVAMGRYVALHTQPEVRLQAICGRLCLQVDCK